MTSCMWTVAPHLGGAFPSAGGHAMHMGSSHLGACSACSSACSRRCFASSRQTARQANRQTARQPDSQPARQTDPRRNACPLGFSYLRVALHHPVAVRDKATRMLFPARAIRATNLKTCYANESASVPVIEPSAFEHSGKWFPQAVFSRKWACSQRLWAAGGLQHGLTTIVGRRLLYRIVSLRDQRYYGIASLSSAIAK